MMSLTAFILISFQTGLELIPLAADYRVRLLVELLACMRAEEGIRPSASKCRFHYKGQCGPALLQQRCDAGTCSG